MEPFFEILHAIGQHDATAVLATIEVPGLAGDGRSRSPGAAGGDGEDVTSDPASPRRSWSAAGRTTPPSSTPVLVARRIERFYRDHQASSGVLGGTPLTPNQHSSPSLRFARSGSGSGAGEEGLEALDVLREWPTKPRA